MLNVEECQYNFFMMVGMQTWLPKTKIWLPITQLVTSCWFHMDRQVNSTDNWAEIPEEDQQRSITLSKETDMAGIPVNSLSWMSTELGRQWTTKLVEKSKWQKTMRWSFPTQSCKATLWNHIKHSRMKGFLTEYWGELSEQHAVLQQKSLATDRVSTVKIKAELITHHHTSTYIYIPFVFFWQ